jgi:hypothetical protein
MEEGLAAVVAGGWRGALLPLVLSCLITAGSMLRLSFVISALELAASPHQLALLLVMSGLMRCMPAAVPGADAWATSRLARIVHVAGSGISGFVILWSAIGIMESPLLAAGVLLWWALPRSTVGFRLGELVSLVRRSAVDASSTDAPSSVSVA